MSYDNILKSAETINWGVKEGQKKITTTFRDPLSFKI